MTLHDRKPPARAGGRAAVGPPGRRGGPQLAVNRLVYDTEDRPVQWLQGLYRPDRYQYRMKLNRVQGRASKMWSTAE